MQTGELIKKARLQAKLTQAELANRLEVTPQAISQYERGVKNPKVETVKKIAAALGVQWYELYPVDVPDEEVAFLFGGLDKETHSKDYNGRIDSSAVYLQTAQDIAEEKTGIEWSSDAKNSWMKEHLPEVAKMFNVKEDDLDNKIYWSYTKEEAYLTAIHEAILNTPIRSKSLEKICRMLIRMNADGQALAAERVEELAQIPKYQRAQRAQSAPQDTPAGSDDKTPAEK